MQRIVRYIVLGAIRLYRTVISPVLGPRCRFYPTCSDYASQSIMRYGTLKGGYLTLRRLIKCHPFHPGGYDPVPEATQTDKTELTE